MSKLDELIAELCPEGVETVTLGELENRGSLSLGRGNVISKKEMQNFPGEYPVYSSSALGDGEIGRYGKYMFDDERITWSIDGGGKLFYRNGLKYSVTNVGGWIKVKSEELSTKYLYYALINQWCTKKFDYTKKAHPSIIRDEYNVPLPPLPVQREIVRILDCFTSLTAELTAELTARKKQYEYYRDELLTFDNNTRFERLGDTCSMRAGKPIDASQISTEHSETISYKCFGGNGVRGYVPSASHHGEFPIIGRQGALCGNVNYAIGDFYATEHAVVVESKGQYEQRFLYHLLIFMKLNQYKSKGAQPGLSVRNLENLIAPVPPIKEQRRIVSILDRFDALCNDLTFGLPAETTARKKQYEYYRDKLLTF